MTDEGGVSNEGTVFEITAAGTETVLHSLAGGPTDGAYPYGSLIQAGDGNLYGMTESGGAYGLGIVFKMTPGGTETVLHSFAGTTTDGANPEGSLIQANAGNLYGMSQNGGAYISGAIFEITPTGTESVPNLFCILFPALTGVKQTPTAISLRPATATSTCWQTLARIFTAKYSC